MSADAVAGTMCPSGLTVARKRGCRTITIRCTKAFKETQAKCYHQRNIWTFERTHTHIRLLPHTLPGVRYPWVGCALINGALGITGSPLGLLTWAGTVTTAGAGLFIYTQRHTHTHEEDDPHHQNIRFITHLSRRRRLTFLHSPGGWASSSCRWDLWSRRRGSSGPPARRWPSPPSCWAPSLGTSACQPPPVTRNQEEDEEGEEEGQEEESEEEEREEHHEFR